MARAMKDSGIEWLGDIPADWNVVSVGRLFSISAGGDAKPDYYSDTHDDAHPYPVYTNSMNKNQVYAYTSKPIYSGDTITVTGRGAIGTAFYRYTPYDAIIRLLSLSPKLNLDGRFYAYWISNVIHFFTDSAAVGQLSSVQMSSYKTVYFSKDEQSRIANFLDSECARIDSVVEKTRASIEEYKKLKQFIITQAVTKGIRPNRKLKHSGVEWLGDIPSDWEVGRLKNLFILQRGYDLPSEKFVEGDFPIYGSGGLMGYHNQKTSMAPNVLIGRSGSTGKLHYIEKDFWAHNTGIFISDKKGNFCKYLYYLLNVVDMEELSTKTAVPTLDRKKIQEYRLPYTTDIDEQKEIAHYLDEKTAAIDSLIAKKNQLVTELESLKKSLIFEYVTGKKEVPT